ncbi:MAG: IPTL-CTERM sorting domain-containing protein [Thermodesulfobacteriota bacterium]
MKRLNPAVYLFFLLLSISSSSYALDFIKFGTSHDVDFWGTPNFEFGTFPSTLQYLAARGKNEITSLTLTDGNVENVFNGDFGSFDAIVVSESIQSLSPESYALFNQYVSGGGCVIVTGSHAQGEDEFLNNSFGYGVSVTDVQDVVDTFAIQSGAVGTLFEGGPSNLVAADLTSAYSNTPGTVIYSGPTGVALFTAGFGEGIVNAIGWDYCCLEGAPNTPDQILAWYEVVNRAFNQCTGGSDSISRPIPTLSEWGLIAMAGILGIFGLFAALRRRKVTA